MEYRGSACLEVGSALRADLAVLGRRRVAPLGRDSDHVPTLRAAVERGRSTLPNTTGCDVITSLPRHLPPGAATRHPKLSSTFAPLHRPQADLHFCTFLAIPCPHVTLPTCPLALRRAHLCTGRRPICTFAPRTARRTVPTRCLPCQPVNRSTDQLTTSSAPILHTRYSILWNLEFFLPPSPFSGTLVVCPPRNS